METHAHNDTIRDKAIAFVQDRVEKVASKSSHDIACSIVDNTFADGKPVKECILTGAANGVVGTPSAAREGTLKSKSSFSRLKRTFKEGKLGSSESKAAPPATQVGDQQHDYRNLSADQLWEQLYGESPNDASPMTSQTKKDRNHKSSITGRANTIKGSGKVVPGGSCFPASEKAPKASGSIQYNCIVCRSDLSSKGVCKRHLEEQHVLAKVYKCEKCHQSFFVKADAKKHVHECSNSLFSFKKEKVEKRVYACEFTGRHFYSLSIYVEHLLRLSQKSETRPKADIRRKLYALLDQPGLQHHLAEISSRKFESRHAWRNLHWSEAHISKAIEDLENAVVHEDGKVEFIGLAEGLQKPPSIRPYLNFLLGAGTMPRPSPSQPVPPESGCRSRSGTLTRQQSPGSGTPTPTASTYNVSQVPQTEPNLKQLSDSTPMVSPSIPVYHTDLASAQTKEKRHLSYESRHYVPSRNPPGPPPPPVPQFPYNFQPAMQQQHAIPNASATSNASVISLPYRNSEGLNVGEAPEESFIALPHEFNTSVPGSAYSSDAASASTLRASYQEPEPVDLAAFDYTFLPMQQGMPGYPFTYNNGNDINYGVSYPEYNDPTDISLRASSVATDQTYAVDVNEYEQKLSNFDPLPLDHMYQNGGTFLNLDDNDFDDSYSIT